jgi:hypothetical protein
MDSSRYLREIIYQHQSPAAIAYFEDRAASLFATDPLQSYIDTYVRNIKNGSDSAWAKGDSESFSARKDATNDGQNNAGLEPEAPFSDLLSIRTTEKLKKLISTVCCPCLLPWVLY